MYWVKWALCSVTQLCPTLCDPMDCQAPLSMGFSRQESWSGLPFPSPGDLPDPGNKPGSPALQADSLSAKLQGKPNWNVTWLIKRKEVLIHTATQVNCKSIMWNQRSQSPGMIYGSTHRKNPEEANPPKWQKAEWWVPGSEVGELFNRQRSLLCFILAAPCSLWDLSSPSRD